ncbi:MAG: aspartate aminotransferase family protein [Alphaproteobacteria bacterium]
MSATYPDFSSKSAALYERARRVMPGGSTRVQTFFNPYPVFAARAEGCRVIDVDGAARIDFVNNYTVQIHGHSHPKIVEAVKKQAEQAMCFTLPTETEIELAEIFCERTASIERVRFANSGTEAVMNAIKAARAHTGRPKIAKCEGVYHGSYDYAEASLDPDPQNWGARDPAAVGYARSAPAGMLADVVVIPFNDVDASRRILEANADRLAGLLVDLVPTRCGGGPASPEYRAMLREVTRRHGIVLICDEVVTYRLDYGGAQALYGFDPDLTTLGNIIGRGMPIGAIAGKAEFMAVFDASQGKPLCPHSGTFTANPVSMAAGIAAMRMFDREAIERLNALGAKTRAQLDEAFKVAGVTGHVTGEGSLFLPHLSDEPLGDYRKTYRAHSDAAGERAEALFRLLLNEGIYSSVLGLNCLSTPMGEAEIDRLSEAVLKCLRIIKDEAPARAVS